MNPILHRFATVLSALALLLTVGLVQAEPEAPTTMPATSGTQTTVPTTPVVPEKPWLVSGTAAGQEIVGPDGGTMVWVPAGQFQMGMEAANPDARPVHCVTITRGFWLGKCEVTNAQYKAFCQQAKYTFPARNDHGDDHPVAYVNWDDAMAYCKHFGLSLPTEAQWEWAARGPENRKYPWGNDYDPGKFCSKQNVGPNGATYPVGSFPTGASWCGALDMAGNVWEWCSDWYDAKYYGKCPANDPAGQPKGTYHVVRGGGWLNFGNLCLTSVRSYYLPFAGYKHGGFRCVFVPAK